MPSDARALDIAVRANAQWGPDVFVPVIRGQVTGDDDDPIANANVTATFSEMMNPLTVNTSTFQLRDSAGNIVPATQGRRYLESFAIGVPPPAAPEPTEDRPTPEDPYLEAVRSEMRR